MKPRSGRLRPRRSASLFLPILAGVLPLLLAACGRDAMGTGPQTPEGPFTFVKVEGPLQSETLHDLWLDGAVVTVVGEGVILRSPDAGVHWDIVLRTSNVPNYQGIWGDGAMLPAVGGYGAVRRSTNVNWMGVTGAPVTHYTDVWGTPAAVVAVGSGGTIARSTTQGLFWEAVSSGTIVRGTRQGRRDR